MHLNKQFQRSFIHRVSFIFPMEFKLTLFLARHGEAYGRICQIPVVGFIDLKALVNKGFFIPKGGFVFDLGFKIFNVVALTFI